MSTFLIIKSLRHSMMCSFFVLVTLCQAVADLPPEATAQTEVWISATPIAGGGSGTASNPYDGSTQTKFDAVMYSFWNTPNLTIHLGPGTFRSNVTATNKWKVRPGWTIQGSGMYSTICQMMGNMTGMHADVEFFKSAFDVSTNGVTIRDLTVDCNWAELSLTADMGAGGEKWGTVYSIDLAGSYNLIEQVRQINGRGTLANGGESFGIRLAAPKTGDGTGNTIRYCRVELPKGNHDAPFGLQGTFSGSQHFITNTALYGNYAAGLATGNSSGFSSGGVNAAFIKNCWIHDNIFVDCLSIYYQDTGSAEGIHILNNKLVRGWLGVGFIATYAPSTKQNIEIAGNSFNLQNRIVNGATHGIVISGAASSKLSISGNYFSFNATGLGYKEIRTMLVAQDVNTDITKNTADDALSGLIAPIMAYVSGSNVQMWRNRSVTGLTMNGLSDNVGSWPAAGKPVNFSTRGKVGTGENALINGFIITGSSAKKVVVRATGPSLTQHGVAGALSDPTLALYNSAGSLLASNDNWRDTQQTEIAGTGLQPSNNLESAIVRTLAPGAYTAVTNGKNGATGIGLVEIYDVQTASSTLGNVSTRGFVGTGEEVLISGIIIGSGTNPAIVARALGPSLASSGIQHPLADPVLELHDGNGTLIAENNDWADTQTELIQATGLAPSNSREAAIMVSPAPGNYTTILRGKSDTTGIGLVEVFQLN